MLYFGVLVCSGNGYSIKSVAGADIELSNEDEIRVFYNGAWEQIQILFNRNTDEWYGGKFVDGYYGERIDLMERVGSKALAIDIPRMEFLRAALAIREIIHGEC